MDGLKWCITQHISFAELEYVGLAFITGEYQAKGSKESIFK